MENELKVFKTLRNPVRYMGGEFGSIVKKEAAYTMAIAFPDLYEIAMSNQAVKIIYKGINDLAGVRCERVFAPDTDYEDVLKKSGTALATLETHIPLWKTDLIGFSIGYELGLTEVFALLDCGRVPLRVSERHSEDPIVIAGGCGVTNPAPFASFFEGIFIGEAEAGFFDLVSELSKAKKNGKNRTELIDILHAHPSVYFEGRKTAAVRAVWADFGRVPSVDSIFPQPNTKPVQDHGVTEIMRGCPNGCRFCHAGIFYRPQRIKPVDRILGEVEDLVSRGGYQEVSLTSLSSADYPYLKELLDRLDAEFSGRKVSFQLPSLKVNSTTLPILAMLSRVRKSALTFAIETPEDSWQLALNKEVYTKHLLDIIRDAKAQGWSSAKFYFMIGLPVLEKGYREEELIVDFMRELQARARIQCSVSVGVYVPKAHTPFQWCAQLAPEEAEKRFAFIRENLPRGKFKVSTHGAFLAYLEGLISRGDKRVGELVLEAYRRGCRFDAWDDHFRENAPLWRDVLACADWDAASLLREKSPPEENDELPWDGVSLGVTKEFLKNEYQASKEYRLTPRCDVGKCRRCGVCGEDRGRREDTNQAICEDAYKTAQKRDGAVLLNRQPQNIAMLWRALFQFSKLDGGEYLSHLSMQEIFRKAFIRTKLPVQYTQGFNPMPRLEFVGNLPVGIESTAEIGACVLDTAVGNEDFVRRINEGLPPGIRVTRSFVFPVSNKRKRESLFSSWWGSTWEANGAPFDVAAAEEKAFREDHAGDAIKKIAALTKEKTSFFEAYEKIALINKALIGQGGRRPLPPLS